MSMPSRESLIAARKRHFAPTAFLYYAEPLHLVSAEGMYVFDDTGRRYLDAFGGIVCISAGHNHPRIKAEIRKMLDANEIQHTSTIYLSRHMTELAQALLRHAPEGLDRCYFTNSGSEANEVALLVARQATGEPTVLSLRHGYHGGTAATLAQCGQHSWRFRAQPVSQVTSALEPNCYRCPFGQRLGSCALECARHVEEAIQTTTHGRIAAMIAEPVMGVGGFIAPPDEYFHEVARIVHEYGGRMIIDEVQTGAARCGGTLLLTRALGIDADMVTMAKGFGNGAAIGAALLKTEDSDRLAGKIHFNTFGGDPYQTMQARLTIEIIEQERLAANALEMGARLREGMLGLARTHPLIGDVRGRGLLLGMELVTDRATKAHAPVQTARLMDLCRERGLLVGKGGLMGNVVRIAPPLAITPDQVDFMLQTFDESLHALATG